MKKKILWYSDTPTSTTGFGNVARNLIKRLGNDYDITVIGINSDGHPYDKDELPCKIYPAFSFHPLNQDGNLYGYNKLLHFIATQEWDYVFVLQDTFIAQNIAEKIYEIKEAKEKNKQKSFKFVLYFPTDMPLHPDWIKKSILLADIPVSYNQYGIDMVMDQLKNIPEVKNYDKILKKIYHGSDSSVFKKLEDDKVKEFSKKYFQGKVEDDDFLIVNVNRNQSRKDIARTLMIFKQFSEEVPNAKLYTHCIVEGDPTGADLLEVARRINLDISKWVYPMKELAIPGMGMPMEYINLIYNRANVNISTSLGEGWGLSITEAMLAQTINLVPKHTSFKEMIGDYDRGYFIEAGNTSSHFVVNGMNDNNVVRPICDVDDAVTKLLSIYSEEEAVQEKIKSAYEWATTELDWDKIADQWKTEVFI